MDGLWKFLSGLSFTEVVLLILLIYGGRLIFTVHQRQLNDRQREIDRLAEDNREYRERFLWILDRRLGVESEDDGKQRQTGDEPTTGD